MTLDPGWTFTGTVLGPDGKPLAGARGFALGDRTSRGLWDRESRKTAEFTVHAYNPRRPRDIFFLHLERELVGEVEPPKENGAAVTVRMKLGAAVTGNPAPTSCNAGGDRPTARMTSADVWNGERTAA